MTISRTIAGLVLALLCLVLLLAGCGGGAASPPTAQATSAAAATIPSSPTAILSPTLTPLPTVGTGALTCTAVATAPFPRGTYSPTDAQGHFVDTSQQGPITFKSDGSFNRAGTQGCFVLVHQHIIFTDQVNRFNACSLHVQTGDYLWAYDGSLLSFTPVNDPCIARADIFNKYKWRVLP